MSRLEVVASNKSREEWAMVITEDWRKSIENIIEAGRNLIAAKAELPHGEFGKMIKSELPFGVRTAQALMAIASHPGIGNAKSISHLPPSWAVLSELARLSGPQFEEHVASGRINPDISTSEARKLVIDERPETLAKPPADAKRIARETGIPQVGSDGNIHFGVDEAVVRDAREKRDQTYTVIDAVNALSAMPSIEEFVAGLEPWRMDELDPDKIAAACEWLWALLPEIKELKNGK